MKQPHTIICALFFLVFSINNIYSQNNAYTITGTILDSRSNEPLFYVNVGLVSEADSAMVSVATTDKDGVFKLLNVKVGHYIIKTSYIGYDIYQQPVSITNENRIIETILLQPAATTLQDITVSATKPVFMNDGEKILYNVSEDPSVQTGTASDALQNAPGVEVDIEGNVTLRGVSSVEIWINGRKSRLEAENLKTYLQQLPANSLERIEVINNPSARYAASGTGGIINIVTKSNIQKNSFLSFGINGSTRPMTSPWLSYMFSNEKFSINVYLYGYYNFSKGRTTGYNVIFNDAKDTSSYKSYTMDWKDNSIWTGGYVSGSYQFDSLKTLSFWSGVYGMPWVSYSSSLDNKYREYINKPGIYDYEEEATIGGNRYGGHLGVDYEHNFNGDGHKLVTEISGSFWKPNRSESIKRTYDNFPYLNKDRKVTQNGITYYLGSEINYSLPYHKDGVIEMGAEGRYSNEAVINRTDTLLAGKYVLDSMRYDNYVGQWGSLDVYTTVKHKFGGFTIKGGLRLESIFLSRKNIDHPAFNGSNNFANLFPSLHLTYVTKSMHNFNLSYSRRVNYQRNSQLYTFKKYGEDSFTIGNEGLKPTFTNSIEGGWTKYFNKFGSVGLSAYYRNNRNEVNNLTDVMYDEFFGRYVGYSMPVNSGKSHRYGGEVNITYKLKAFMSIRLNANFYQSHSETVFRSNEKPVITDFFAYSFRLNFWAKVWKYLEVNASGNYRSKTKTIFTEYQPSYSINCGLRSDVWDRKISIFLNVQDIFNWGRERVNNNNPYYVEYNSRKWNSRFISAGITFRFGKIEMESKARTGGNME